MNKTEKAAIKREAEQSNDFFPLKESTAYTPAVFASTTRIGSGSGTGSGPGPGTPPTYFKTEDDGQHLELSQVSCGDTMLQKYEPVMHEVLGPDSKLSQELTYDANQSQVTDPAIFGALSSQSYSVDSKPPPLPQSQGQGQGNLPLPPPPHLSQQIYLQASQEPSQQYQMSMSQQISQPFQMTQQPSQQFSMTISSLPSLPVSQPFSLQDPPPLPQTNASNTTTPAITKVVPYNLPQKSITKSSIIRTKNQKVSSDVSFNASTASRNQRRSIEQQCAEEDSMKLMAKRAVDLINTLAENKKVEKQILLSMTLTRQSPRTAGLDTLPPPGTKLAQGFQWAQFPPLEKYLKDHMEEYYELSIEKCQSVLQQEFNNKLVTKVIEMATFYGWTFDFTHKGIRDRVRCYFKTHIQNAKKRLKTMCKNPTKRANAKALCAHLDLIELHQETHDEIEFANDFMKDRGSSFSLNADVDIETNLDDEDAAKVVRTICIFLLLYT